MASVFYDGGKRSILGGSPAINLLTDTINLILVGSGYTPTVTHSTINDIGANEVAATGNYTSGGVTLGSKAISIDATNHRAYFTSAAALWSTATITASFAVMYKRVGGSMATTDPMVACYDFGGSKSSSNGNFSVTPDATNGWFYI